jgi:hypothetical protein
MTSAPTLARVQAIVTGVAGPNRVPDGAGPDTPLQDGGFWLDSAAVVEVMIGTVRTLFELVRDRRRP